MKRAVKVAIVAAMLQGSAHAAEKVVASDAAAQQERGKVATIQQAPRSGKQTRMAARKTGNPTKAVKVVPQEVMKQEEATGTPPESIEQTVQLRGVRG